MIHNKALGAYETKGVATEEIARKIADVLRCKYQLVVDLVNDGVQEIPDCYRWRRKR